MATLERRLKIIKQLKDSLSKELEASCVLDELVDGEGVQWRLAQYSGTIHFIDETQDGTIILDFDKFVSTEVSNVSSVDLLRDVLQVYDRIKKYLEENGEAHNSMYEYRSGFYFKNGFPGLTK